MKAKHTRYIRPSTPCPAPCLTCLPRKRHRDCLTASPRYNVPKVPQTVATPPIVVLPERGKAKQISHLLQLLIDHFSSFFALPGTLELDRVDISSLLNGGRLGFINRGQQRVPTRPEPQEDPSLPGCASVTISLR